MDDLGATARLSIGGEGDTGANDMIGEEADLNRNLVSLLTSTPDLTEEEITLFGELQRERIKRW